MAKSKTPAPRLPVKKQKVESAPHFAVMDVLPDPVVAFDALLKVTYSNKAAQGFFRLSDRQFIDKYMVELLGSGKDPVFKSVEDAVRKSQSVTLNDVSVQGKPVTSVIISTVEVGALYMLLIRQKPMHLSHDWKEVTMTSLFTARQLADEIEEPLASIDGSLKQLTALRLNVSDKSAVKKISQEAKKIQKAVARHKSAPAPKMKPQVKVKKILTEAEMDPYHPDHLFDRNDPMHPHHPDHLIYLARLEELQRVFPAPSLSFPVAPRPEQQEVDLKNLHEQLLRATRDSYGKDIRIKEYLDPNLPNIQGHFDHLMQANMNLIRNAAEAFNQDQKKKHQISIRTFYDPKAKPHPTLGKLPLCIEIEDNGKGIAPDAMSHIFQPFYSTKQNSHGMGLPVVSKIVEEHGGVIKVVSEPGKTIFRINLPMPGADPNIALHKGNPAHPKHPKHREYLARHSKFLEPAPKLDPLVAEHKNNPAHPKHPKHKEYLLMRQKMLLQFQPDLDPRVRK